MQERRQRQLQEQRRRAYLDYLRRYWERIRRDQLRLQRERYYNNLLYNYRYYRDGSYYYTSSYGDQMIRDAIAYGYEEGYRAGRADREDGWGYDYQSSYAYIDASYGYDDYYIDLDEYSYYFREGFRRGYDDGYYGRYQYGRYRNNKYEILSTILKIIYIAVRF
jgi:hypothetical protein